MKTRVPGSGHIPALREHGAARRAPVTHAFLPSCSSTLETVMRTGRRVIWTLAVAVGTGCGPTSDVASPDGAGPPAEVSLDRGDADGHHGRGRPATTLYV